MSCVNKVILIGNLGHDPELRYTATGRAMACFSMATTDNWRDAGGEWQQQTEWHNVVAWGERAESLNNRLARGSRIYVEGKLKHRSVEDKEGNRRNFTDVHVMRAFPLSRSGNGAEAAGPPVEPPDEAAESVEKPKEEDVPF